jgi:hypothetical protein
MYQYQKDLWLAMAIQILNSMTIYKIIVDDEQFEDASREST